MTLNSRQLVHPAILDSDVEKTLISVDSELIWDKKQIDDKINSLPKLTADIVIDDNQLELEDESQLESLSDGFEKPHQCQCRTCRHANQSTGIRVVKSSASAAQCITLLYIHHLLHADDQVVTKSVYKRFEQVTG